MPARPPGSLYIPSPGFSPYKIKTYVNKWKEAGVVANNRMWLRCKICGEAVLLAKNYGAWYACHSEGTYNEYYLRHEECMFGSDGQEDCEECFELVYESQAGNPSFIFTRRAEKGRVIPKWLKRLLLRFYDDI